MEVLTQVSDFLKGDKMKRSIRQDELTRLRVLANLVKQSRDFHAYNSVVIRKELKSDIIRPRSVTSK